MNELEVKETKSTEEVVDVKAGLVCVYGTLRLGNGNWRGYLDGKSTYLGQFRTEPNFTMIGKNMGFPYVVDNGTTSIVCDVFAVDSKRHLESIDALEGCYYPSGDVRNTFYDSMTVTTPWGDAKMYVIHREQEDINQDRVITSGDWDDRSKN